MRRIAIMLAMSVSVLLLLAACKTGIERKAEKQLKATLLELAKNPETFDISKVETKYCCDSLCILHCMTKGQNGFGGYSSSYIEYIYLIDKGKRYECVTDLEDESSVFTAYGDPEKLSEDKADRLYLSSVIRCVLDGREVLKR